MRSVGFLNADLQNSVRCCDGSYMKLLPRSLESAKNLFPNRKGSRNRHLRQPLTSSDRLQIVVQRIFSDETDMTWWPNIRTVRIRSLKVIPSLDLDLNCDLADSFVWRDKSGLFSLITTDGSAFSLLFEIWSTKPIFRWIMLIGLLI